MDDRWRLGWKPSREHIFLEEQLLLAQHGMVDELAAWKYGANRLRDLRLKPYHAVKLFVTSCLRVLEVGCETEKAVATEQLAFTAAALQTQHLQHLQDEADLVADLKQRSFGHLIEVLALGGVTMMSSLVEAQEHFQEWKEELPRTLSEHELAVLSEIVGYEPSEAESMEARVLELATGKDSEVGLAERCLTVEEVLCEVMENLDESADDEDKDKVGSFPNESDASRQQRKKDFQDLIGHLRSNMGRLKVAHLMAKTDLRMT